MDLKQRPSLPRPRRLQAFPALLFALVFSILINLISGLPLDTNSAENVAEGDPTTHGQHPRLEGRRFVPLGPAAKDSKPVAEPFQLDGANSSGLNAGTVSETSAVLPTATGSGPEPTEPLSDSLPLVPNGPLIIPSSRTTARTRTTTRVLPTIRVSATISLRRPLRPIPFRGVGVQFMPFEYYPPPPSRIVESDRRMSLTRFSSARIMLRAWWYCTGYNSSTNEPIFDFENGGLGRMKDLWRALEYLKEQKVDVIIGEWDDPTSPYDRPNLYGKQPDPDPLQQYNIANTDPRWSRLISSFLLHATRVKNITNIRQYNLINEPNAYYSNNRDYGTWSRAVGLLIAELQRKGLDIEVIGPDVTEATDWIDMMLEDPTLKGKIGAVDMHRYLDNIEQLESGRAGDEIFSDWRRRTDAKGGRGMPVIVTEAGVSVGKVGDSQTLRYTADYGRWMADYTIQTLRAGLQGVLWWNVDDAYLVGGGYGSLNLKGWGFWNSLAGQDGYPETDFDVRPWFYAFQLLARYLPKGAQPLVTEMVSPDPRVRCTAARYAYAPNNLESFNATERFGGSARGWSWHLTVVCVSHVDAVSVVDLRIDGATSAGSTRFFSTFNRAARTSTTMMDLYRYIEGDLAVKRNGFPRVRGRVGVRNGRARVRMGKGVVVLTTMGRV